MYIEVMAEDDDAPPIAEPLKRVFEQVTTYGEGSSGSAKEEIAQLQGILERSPENLDVQEWLAFKLYSEGDLLRAERHYKQLIDKAHRIGAQYFYLGNTYYKMGRFAEAVKCWQETVSRLPTDAKAMKARARIEKVRREHAGV